MLIHGLDSIQEQIEQSSSGGSSLPEPSVQLDDWVANRNVVHR